MARARNMQGLQSARSELSAQKQKKWAWDKKGSYEQKKAARDKLIGAGMQNLVKAGGTLAGGSMLKGGGASLGSLFGGGKAAAAQAAGAASNFAKQDIDYGAAPKGV